MGLDITAYRALTAVAHDMTDDETCEDDGHVRLWVNPDFAAHADGLATGCYTTSEKEHWFRAGSYIGYGHWREALAKLAGYPGATATEGQSARDAIRDSLPHSASVWDGATGPFAELINFSDCEGLMGPETSKKLLADFEAFDERAKAAFDEYSYGKYRDWRKAFELASHGGAVQFH